MQDAARPHMGACIGPCLYSCCFPRARACVDVCKRDAMPPRGCCAPGLSCPAAGPSARERLRHAVREGEAHLGGRGGRFRPELNLCVGGGQLALCGHAGHPRPHLQRLLVQFRADADGVCSDLRALRSHLDRQKRGLRRRPAGELADLLQAAPAVEPDHGKVHGLPQVRAEGLGQVCLYIARRALQYRHQKRSDQHLDELV
mmetsp:Transcript_99281/g.303586  ORF Transcript_99281/g.303586 Transcript_99281/m.303586 type:complete len:201 (+) Transcript_99281:30-632(+)